MNISYSSSAMELDLVMICKTDYKHKLPVKYLNLLSPLGQFEANYGALARMTSSRGSMISLHSSGQPRI